MSKRPWKKTAGGGWITMDGRWRIRGPIFGKPMFWLYRDGGRYTPTGRFEDAMSFQTANQAKQFVNNLMPILTSETADHA